MAGFIAGAFYTLPPFRWAYRGVGEALIGLTYGPLITIGACYVQLARLPSLELIILPSLVPGFLITAVIWINEFPDFFADKKVGKKNLVVRLGRKKATTYYALLLAATYIPIVMGIFTRLSPFTTSVALLTLPLACRNIYITKRKYNKPQELTPAMSGTILLFASTTLLLAIGYLLTPIN
jgi:1,4-dihydroxy-2-naphthoate octaprenyltransferase